ncbi:hypothetical protein BC829DRAFT_395440 [Chytridium lagenaria]|nr:hypothetical protein BC829DRAFT_395440 [Chytridium lagenaria]
MNHTDDQGPFLIPSYDAGSHSVASWGWRMLFERTCEVMKEAVEGEDPESNPHRIGYALIGLCFIAHAPRPIGGKRSPGFVVALQKVERDDELVEHLVDWILSSACLPPKTGRGYRTISPGECLRFVVGRLNQLLMWKWMGRRDEIDNALLRGMTLAGTLKDHRLLPPHLRDGARGVVETLTSSSSESTCALRKNNAPPTQTFSKKSSPSSTATSSGVKRSNCNSPPRSRSSTDQSIHSPPTRRLSYDPVRDLSPNESRESSISSGRSHSHEDVDERPYKKPKFMPYYSMMSAPTAYMIPRGLPTAWFTEQSVGSSSDCGGSVTTTTPPLLQA